MISFIGLLRLLKLIINLLDIKKGFKTKIKCEYSLLGKYISVCLSVVLFCFLSSFILVSIFALSPIFSFFCIIAIHLARGYGFNLMVIKLMICKLFNRRNRNDYLLIVCFSLHIIIFVHCLFFPNHIYIFADKGERERKNKY
mgnify:FL=1